MVHYFLDTQYYYLLFNYTVDSLMTCFFFPRTVMSLSYALGITLVLILNGNTEIGAHVRSNLFYMFIEYIRDPHQYIYYIVIC